MSEDSIHLWLDDVRAMPENFTHHATTAWEAIDLLQTGRVKTLSLDHDLGPESAGTGYDVAKWIEQAAHSNSIPPVRWMLHSSNPVGRQNMGFALDQAILHWANHGEIVG